MSRVIKPQNKLEDEILNKIAILLDKPISNKSTKEIIDAIEHPSSPKEKILNLLTIKYRSDLIIEMMQSCPYLFLNEILLTDFITNIQKNILNYTNFNSLISIWKGVINLLNKEKNDNKSLNERQELIYRIGYEDLLKEGIKVANLEKKERIFELIYANIKLFWELGMKDNLRKVIVTYVEVFRKFPIVVVGFVKVMGLIVELVYEKRYEKYGQKEQEEGYERQEQEQTETETKIIPNLYKLPSISTEHLTQILFQLHNILSTTKEKPLHLLHNECLQTLILILTITNNKNNELLINNQLHNGNHFLYELNKMLETFLYRKGTREEARKLVVILTRVEGELLVANKEKMEKDYSSSSESRISAKIKEYNNNKPILIENVIHRTNEFMAKYHVNNIVRSEKSNNKSDDHSRIKSPHKLVNINYLKKGEGMGGGRAILEIDTKNIINNKNSNNKELSKEKNNPKNVIVEKKKKDKYELLLENCLLESGEKEQRYEQEIKAVNSNKVITAGNNNYRENDNKQQQDKQQQNFYNININKHKPNNKQIPSSTNQPPIFEPQFYESIYSEFYEEQEHSEEPHFRNNNNLYNNCHDYNENNRTFCDSNITEDDVNEINELIDLAYSYKFGGCG